MGIGQEIANVFVSFETIEHIKDIDRYFNSVISSLIPGGLFIISTPNRILSSPGVMKGGKPINPHHIFEWDIFEFVSVLESYFQNVKIFGQCWTNHKFFFQKLITFPLRALIKKVKIFNPYGLATKPGNLFWNNVMQAPLYFIAVCRKDNNTNAKH